MQLNELPGNTRCLQHFYNGTMELTEQFIAIEVTATFLPSFPFVPNGGFMMTVSNRPLQRWPSPNCTCFTTFICIRSTLDISNSDRFCWQTASASSSTSTETMKLQKTHWKKCCRLKLLMFRNILPTVNWNSGFQSVPQRNHLIWDNKIKWFDQLSNNFN